MTVGGILLPLEKYEQTEVKMVKVFERWILFRRGPLCNGRGLGWKVQLFNTKSFEPPISGIYELLWSE